MAGEAWPVFPFSALVGQERMKLALLLVAVDPSIGGVLIRGEKGSAKSTAVRALAGLLPPIEVVEGCPFACEPEEPQGLCEVCRGRAGPLPTAVRPVRLVDLPMGATEDRVVGTLDLESALREGVKRLQPGLLAQAHRGILYIDEVNLLADHLADLLLDAAAMGRNYVEREGISLSHRSRFILIGTMNPEEGEVRPQLLDRFGLAVEAERITDPSLRAEVVRRRLAFDRDPYAFVEEWREQEEALRRRIKEARLLLPSVQGEEGLLEAVARLCLRHGVDGLRADIALYKAALAHAALQGRTRATGEDLEAVADLALRHRASSFTPPPPSRPPPRAQAPEPEGTGGSPTGGAAPAGERVFEPGPPPGLPEMLLRVGGSPRARPGKRGVIREGEGRGRYIAAVPLKGPSRDLALDATLRVAVLRRGGRAPRPGLAVAVEREDLRARVREGKAGALLLFLVDASGSMGARRRMSAVKGAILSFLQDAYLRRDRVALLAFRGHRAELILPSTSSGERARRALADLPTGGRTPLALGLLRALEVLERHRRASGGAPSLLVVVTDGRANLSLRGGDPFQEALEVAGWVRRKGFRAVVVDPEERPFSLGFVDRLAEALGAPVLRLEALERGLVEGLARLWL